RFHVLGKPAGTGHVMRAGAYIDKDQVRRGAHQRHGAGWSDYRDTNAVSRRDLGLAILALRARNCVGTVRWPSLKTVISNSPTFSRCGGAARSAGRSDAAPSPVPIESACSR